MLKTNISVDKPAPSWNNGSRPVTGSKNYSKPAFRKTNGKVEVIGVGVEVVVVNHSTTEYNSTI